MGACKNGQEFFGASLYHTLPFQSSLSGLKVPGFAFIREQPTRQSSISRTNRKCLSVLVQQLVVLLISCQISLESNFIHKKGFNE
jgi:hypothetical protein